MSKIDAAKMWALNYRLLGAVLTSVAPEIAALGIEAKDVFLLAELDERPHPAELAAALVMPKPTVTMAVKRLEAMGFIRRAIDAADLRRHRLTLTPAGRRVATRGLALISRAFGERLGKLTAAEQSQLKALVEKMA